MQRLASKKFAMEVVPSRYGIFKAWRTCRWGVSAGRLAAAELA